MAFIWDLTNGNLWHEGKLIGEGYSGAHEGKNNPDMQAVPNVGPIPEGFYTIEPPEDSERHGPFVLPLTPSPTNEMHGRAGFLMHGDSIRHPGEASEGCIIMSRFTREMVWMDGDRNLRVVRSYDAPDTDGAASA